LGERRGGGPLPYSHVKTGKTKSRGFLVKVVLTGGEKKIEQAQNSFGGGMEAQEKRRGK